MKSFFLSFLRVVLKLLAKAVLSRYSPTVVGITGSVGKTSTKEAIASVLSAEKRTRASSKSFNNELGLPLTILGDWKTSGRLWFWLKVLSYGFFELVSFRENYPELLVLEYGVDRPGDMKRLLSIARPQVGVFTAMGEIPVHVEFFAGSEGIFREKVKLLQQLPTTGFAILNADDDKVFASRTQTRAQVVSFGFHKRADVRISNFSQHFEEENMGVTFKLSYGGSFVPIRLAWVFGRSQAYAAAAAAAVGLVFGANLVKASEALHYYEPPQGRLRILHGIKRTFLIDDTYNASPIAMQEALDTLRELSGAKRKIAVLGDMLELGKYTLEAHEKAGRLAARSADLLFTVGLRGKFIAEAAIRAGLPKQSVFTFMSVREAGMALQEKLQAGDVVLFKASQGVRLEHAVKEVMAEPDRAEALLVRQNAAWLKKPGLYD